MVKLYLQLFVQFFHIGFFSFGGGYATLPFLYDIAQNYKWFTTSQLTNMLAISSITPGPVGVNMATFAGYTTSGIVGAFIATVSIMLPSFIFVTIVYKLLDKFKSNIYVKNSVRVLKPAGCALLSAVGLKLLFSSDLNLFGSIFLVIMVVTGFKKKLDPILYLVLSGAVGFILGLFHLIGV